jgi:nucleotide-binding universal stress UspA family protein
LTSWSFTGDRWFESISLQQRVAQTIGSSAEHRPSREVVAREPDLIIGSSRSKKFDGIAAADWPRPEQVALASGRPVLIVPYAGHFDNVGRRVLIAWNATREAARAVSDAMPLLTSTELVTVLTIDPREGPHGHGKLPGADIALHLARHGVEAQIERTVSAGMPVGEVLLSRVADLGADLIVMGAYGHSRAREVLLGGATRSVLRRHHRQGHRQPSRYLLDRCDDAGAPGREAGGRAADEGGGTRDGGSLAAHAGPGWQGDHEAGH